MRARQVSVFSPQKISNQYAEVLGCENGVSQVLLRMKYDTRVYNGQVREAT